MLTIHRARGAHQRPGDLWNVYKYVVERRTPFQTVRLKLVPRNSRLATRETTTRRNDRIKHEQHLLRPFFT